MRIARFLGVLTAMTGMAGPILAQSPPTKGLVLWLDASDRATLDMAPASVIPGSFARLEIVRPGEGPRWIPADAVVARGQLTGLFAVESDTLRLRWVRLGRQHAGAVELLAGPTGDLTVVRRPAVDLHDGRAVRNIVPETFEVVAPAAEAPPVRTAASVEVDG